MYAVEEDMLKRTPSKKSIFLVVGRHPLISFLSFYKKHLILVKMQEKDISLIKNMKKDK
jgi:hypothetical protein